MGKPCTYSITHDTQSFNYTSTLKLCFQKLHQVLDWNKGELVSGLITLYHPELSPIFHFTP